MRLLGLSLDTIVQSAPSPVTYNTTRETGSVILQETPLGQDWLYHTLYSLGKLIAHLSRMFFTHIGA